jgi:hypothetical protein
VVALREIKAVCCVPDPGCRRGTPSARVDRTTLTPHCVHVCCAPHRYVGRAASLVFNAPAVQVCALVHVCVCWVRVHVFCLSQKLAALLVAGCVLAANAPITRTLLPFQAVANNVPDDVFIDAGATSNGTVTSAGYPLPWATVPSSYYMRATVAECSANFSSGITTTCYACSSAEWSPTSCSCGGVVRVFSRLSALTTEAGTGARSCMRPLTLPCPPHRVWSPHTQTPVVDIGLTVNPTTGTVGTTLTYSVTM